MNKIIGSAICALAIVFSLGVSEASAQWRRDDWGRNRGNDAYVQQELNRGYQQGIQTGANDAQRGERYSPERSRYYQRAGSVPFREGFVRGYERGYQQYADYRNNRGYGRDDNRGYGRDDNRGYGRYGGYGNQEELNRGYQQGLETGSSDAQKRQSYEPQRSKHWRNARTQEFREGFARGYDEGYRRYGYDNGRSRNNNRGIGIADILGGILGGRP